MSIWLQEACDSSMSSSVTKLLMSHHNSHTLFFNLCVFAWVRITLSFHQVVCCVCLAGRTYTPRSRLDSDRKRMRRHFAHLGENFYAARHNLLRSGFGCLVENHVYRLYEHHFSRMGNTMASMMSSYRSEEPSGHDMSSPTFTPTDNAPARQDGHGSNLRLPCSESSAANARAFLPATGRMPDHGAVTKNFSPRMEAQDLCRIQRTTQEMAETRLASVEGEKKMFFWQSTQVLRETVMKHQRQAGKAIRLADSESSARHHRKKPRVCAKQLSENAGNSHSVVSEKAKPKEALTNSERLLDARTSLVFSTV